MQFFLMNHLQNARLGSQVKDPGNNVTGLQKHFVKGKGTLAALSEKAAVLPGDGEMCFGY